MAQGKFGGGTGLITDPYLIEDIADLNQIRVNPSLHYKLKYSINAGVAPYNEGNGWNPIENFTGTLDGNGKKIFNLYINRPNEDSVGLFRTLYFSNHASYKPVGAPAHLTLRLDKTIYDLGLENVNITGRNNCGALVGTFNYRGYYGDNGSTFSVNNLFRRIFVTGLVRGSSATAGLIGMLYLRSSGHASGYGYNYVNYISDIISDIYINCTIGATNANINYGGVVGRVYTEPDINTWSNYGNAFRCYVNNLGTNIVSNSEFTASINGLITHPIVATNDGIPVLKISNAYYNKERWLQGTQSQAVALTTEEMKRSTYLGAIVEQVNEFDLSQRTWTFERGRYPQLYFAIANNLFIQTPDGFYSLDKDNKLVKRFDMMPSREEAMDLGFKDISKISNDVWIELRNKYDYVDIIDVIERSSNVVNTMSTHDLDADTTNSTEDRLVYRKKFNFKDFNDGIATIRTV